MTFKKRKNTAYISGKESHAITRFNRKLDHVCERLTRYGVRGLHGGPDRLAVNRRARLVEHAIATRLVTADELYRLSDPAAHDDPQ